LTAFVVKIGAAVFLLIGVVVAVYGTYLMTTAYHPFKKLDLVRNMLRVSFRLVTIQWRAADDLIKDVASVALANPEDRPTSLRGVYFLFVSFLFQTVGAILAVVDVLISRVPGGH